MTNTESIKTAALIAYADFYKFTEQRDDTPTADEIRADIIDFRSIDTANADDDSYSMIFQMTLRDECSIDILIINPSAPIYFLSADAADYIPMINDPDYLA